MTFTPKCIAIIILLFSSSLLVEAQQSDKFKSQFKFGISGGAVFSEVDFVPKIPLNTTQGISAGISAKFISEKYLGVLAELNYTQRGWTEDFSDSPDLNPDHSYNRMLSYIELPLLTHIYFGNKVRFIINLGPQVSYMIGDKGNMNNELSNYIDGELAKDPNRPIGIQYKQIDNKFDYGLLGGVGIEFNTPVGSFDLQGRYYFGLGDSFDNTRSSSSNFSRSAHRYIGGKLTYYFLSL